MENYITLLVFISLIFGILQIILFFKIWGMTNDIRDIKNKYLSENYNESKPDQISTSTPESKINRAPKNIDDPQFKIDDLVVCLKTGNQMRVKEIIDGKFACYSSLGFQGYFEESDIKLFNNQL